MKYNFKIKKGSSLLTMLIFMSIISVIGMSVLSLSLTSYRVRKVNSTEKRNFYASEAGVDEAYAVIGEVVDGALKSAKTEVESAMKSLDLKEEQNKVLNGESSEYVNPDGSINEEAIKNKQDTIFKNEYKNYIQDNIKGKVEDSDEYKYQDNGTKPSIDVITPSSDLVFDGDEMDINIKSTFNHDDIEKEIQVGYEIAVPEAYDSVYYITSNMVNIKKNPVWGNALSVDGDMNVKGSVTLNGDVFVKGKNVGSKGSGENKVIVPLDENKKDSGIILKNSSSTLNVIGDLITAQNIYVESQNSSVTVQGNAYTRNTIISGGGNGSASENAVININKNSGDADNSGKLYTMDDLELNSNKAEIHIQGGYYGVSDGGEKKTHDHSSSIIINAEDIDETDGSKLTIDEELFIAGTSYITLDNDIKYQSGESVAIRGNYKAYGMPLINGNPQTVREISGIDKSLKSENVSFEYIEPLTLVDKLTNKNEDETDDVVMNAIDKSSYLKAYAEDTDYNTDSNYKLNLGQKGLNIKGNIIFNTGAVIKNRNNTDVIDNTINGSKINQSGQLGPKKRDIKKKIYFMGYEDYEGHDITESDLENQTSLISQVNGNDGVNEDGKVKFENISKTKIKNLNGDSIDSTTIIGNDDNIIILDGNSKNYAFVNTDADDIDKARIPASAEKIQIDSSGEFKGIIVVRGNVYLCGELNFSGTIICGGDLQIVDSNNRKVIKHNEAYLSKMIAYNYSKFKSVFINNLESTVKVESELEIAADNPGTDILRDKYIKRNRWKIIK